MFSKEAMEKAALTSNGSGAYSVWSEYFRNSHDLLMTLHSPNCLLLSLRISRPKKSLEITKTVKAPTSGGCKFSVWLTSKAKSWMN